MLLNWHLSDGINGYILRKCVTDDIWNILLMVSKLRLAVHYGESYLLSKQIEDAEELTPPQNSIINTPNNLDVVLELFNAAWTRLNPGKSNVYFNGAPFYSSLYVNAV